MLCAATLACTSAVCPSRSSRAFPTLMTSPTAKTQSRPCTCPLRPLSFSRPVVTHTPTRYSLTTGPGDRQTCRKESTQMVPWGESTRASPLATTELGLSALASCSGPFCRVSCACGGASSISPEAFSAGAGGRKASEQGGPPIHEKTRSASILRHSKRNACPTQSTPIHVLHTPIRRVLQSVSSGTKAISSG